MESDSKPSLLERISHWLMREPEDREQLIELLHGAYENSLMDADALLDQGLIAIHQGASMDAMEDVYTASCLIADIRAALDAARPGVDKSSRA